ncbi:hypothetical protein O181_068777 [Austropuccinia psidii MF-1]|uniref:Uncharacterized protein n=1 Tax=Austropuccinia psidii MF-1 TaxID=1389203 RepID=A0A9Q3I6L6_9BASI|nr:hypothetical protein [Austropuccinia psidii MF-1]
MASTGHFDPSQTYDGYKAVEILDPACTKWLAKGKDCFEHYNPRSSKFYYCYIGKKPCHQTGRQVANVRRYLWSKKDGPSGKEFRVSEAPTPDANSGYSASGSRQRDVARWPNVGWSLPVGGSPTYSSSEVPISRINNGGVVKQTRRIANSPPDPDAEGSDELDGEEAEVVPHSAGHLVNSSPSHPTAKRLNSHVIHNTPRNFQPTLATIPTSIPPSSPNPSHTRPALNQAVRPSPIPQPRDSPMVTSQQPQPVASTGRRREYPNMESENQDAVARLFSRGDRNSREVIMYANNRTIPGTASEEMASNLAWYEDELINDFQRAFDDLGRDN